jgi:hypothetical protein
MIEFVLKFLQTVVGELEEEFYSLIGSLGIADFVCFEAGEIVFLNHLGMREGNKEKRGE